MYEEGGAQIFRPRKNILYTILRVESFLLNEWRDVGSQKSLLKYQIKFDLYHKLHNN